MHLVRWWYILYRKENTISRNPYRMIVMINYVSAFVCMNRNQFLFKSSPQLIKIFLRISVYLLTATKYPFYPRSPTIFGTFSYFLFSMLVFSNYLKNFFKKFFHLLLNFIVELYIPSKNSLNFLYAKLSFWFISKLLALFLI